jgi:hypothetical protein
MDKNLFPAGPVPPQDGYRYSRHPWFPDRWIRSTPSPQWPAPARQGNPTPQEWERYEARLAAERQAAEDARQRQLAELQASWDRAVVEVQKLHPWRTAMQRWNAQLLAQSEADRQARAEGFDNAAHKQAWEAQERQAGR